MIVTYVDETGHPEDHNRQVFGFGGFIARAEDWESFDEEWQGACPSEILPFHMADFAHRRRSFRGWEEEKRRKLLGALIEVIRRNQLVPVRTVIPLAEYRAASKAARARIGNLYFFVLSHFFSQAAMSVVSAQSGQFPVIPPRISVVFAESEFSGRAHDWWYQSRANGQGLLSTLLSGVHIASVSTASPRDTTALQAADLWAYEIGHHFEYILPEEREERWPFQQISSLPSVDGVAVRSFTVLNRDIVEYGNLVIF